MDDRRCPSCGTTSPPDANYCAACGANLDSTFISLDDRPTATEQLHTPSRLAGLVVPLVAIGFLALVAFVLFANGSDTEGDDETAIEDPPTPTANPDLTPVASPEPSPTTAARPEPTAIPTPVVSIDPTSVPPTQATHLAVAYDSSVSFLELGTGAWTTVDAGRRLGLWPGGPFGSRGPLQQFGEGILVQSEHGNAIHFRVDGTLDNVSQGYGAWLMGVRDNRAYLQIDGPEGSRVDVIDPNNAVVESIELPMMTWPQGLTSDGRIVVQAGGRVFALDGSGATEVTAGQLMGALDDLVLIHDCDTAMSCRTDAVNIITGERSSTPLPAGYPEYRSDGLVAVHTDNGERLFEVADGTFTEVERPRSLDPFQPLAIDASGVRAHVRGDVVVFLEGGPNPTELATIPWPAPTRCCRDQLGITFLTIDPDDR